MKRALSLLPFLWLLSSSCSSSTTPSVRECRRVLDEKALRESRGMMKIASFEKTDGQEINSMGIYGYKLEYKATIEFQAECRWAGERGWSGSFRAEPGRNPRNLGYTGLPEAKKGDRATVKGELFFEKTEKGWREAR